MRHATCSMLTAGLAGLAALLLALTVTSQGAPFPSGGASAAEAPAAPADDALASPEAVRALVAELPDEEVRRLLLERLSAVAAERAATEEASAGAGPVAIAERAVAGTFLILADAVLSVPTLVSETTGAAVRFWSERGVVGGLAVFGWLAVAVAAGLAAEALLERAARSWRDSFERMAVSAETLRERVTTLGRRLALDVGKLVVFYVVARIVAVNLIPPAEGPLVSGIATWAILMPRVVAAISRFILSPRAPALRLVAADDAGAAALHRDQVSIALFAGVVGAIVVFSREMGVSPAETRLGFWGSIVVMAWIAATGLRRAATLESMMRGFDAEVTEAEARVARAYPRLVVVATAVAFFGYCALVGNGLDHLVREAQHLTTLAVVLMAPAFDTLVRALVRNLAPPMTGEGEVAAAAHASMQRSWIRIGRVVALGLVLAAISDIWGLGLEGLMGGEAPAAVAALARFVSVLLFGYVAWEVARLWFNTRLMRERTADGAAAPSEDAGEGGGVGGSRLSTVLPLLSFVVQATIVIMTLLVALSNLGVDVTPLLAGAGVLGLAIGFGAQKLVSDVVSGLFFLIDDAFRVGEFVDVGGTTGSVEKISVRSMRLRGPRGPVHTIPYGEIGKITNYSRDWVIMKLRFTVPFETDLEKVRKIFKKIGQEMMEVPELADDFIQPFKSQGVLEVNDVGIVMRGKFMARPGRQFTLRKEIYTRVQRAFEEAGLQFARKEVRVRVDGGEDMPDAERRKAVAAAAHEAAETVADPVAPPVANTP